MTAPSIAAPRGPARDTMSLKLLVRHWSERTGVQPKTVQVRLMKNKLASCSTAGRITLNRKLIKEPRKIQDYVIVHELVHLKVPNHGKLFKAMLAAHLG